VRKRLLVSKMEDCNFRPLRRIRHPLNQQKIRIWRGSGGKNKNDYVQSRNVYENKENMDKVTAKKPDIYGNLTRILQKNSGYYGQSGLIDTFRAGFMRIFVAKISPSPGRAPSAALIPSARGSVKTRADFELPRPAPDGLQLPTQPRFPDIDPQRVFSIIALQTGGLHRRDAADSRLPQSCICAMTVECSTFHQIGRSRPSRLESWRGQFALTATLSFQFASLHSIVRT
jgi:hypothetical protein